jgi:23S rRNA pseudouridine1911/1915/1917 synthase
MTAPEVIFEDESLLVLDKPPGLVVDNSETQKTDTLEEWLKERGITLERGGIVHRLDKDTSGLILVAKTEAVLENLQNQFSERVVKKEYLALVHGEIKEPGVIEGNIGRNPDHREKFTVLDTGGREAVTEYAPERNFLINEERLKEIFPDFNKIQMRKLSTINYQTLTLVRCFPKTGRTHQIRVHLKHIGFPIVSDEKYVGRKMYRLDHRWCPRQFLHAAKISFKHPVSDEPMEFESKLPQDLEIALKFLNG